MLTTTLRKLREAGACKGRYAYLVTLLDGWSESEAKSAASDFSRHGPYKPCAYGDETPIGLETIYWSNGFEDALWSLRPMGARRESVALACLFCAPILNLMTDPRSIAAIDTAMRWLVGEATDELLSSASSYAADVAYTTRSAARAASSYAADAAAYAAYDAAADAAYAAADAAYAAARAAARAASSYAAHAAADAAAYAAYDAAAYAAADAAYAAYDDQERVFCGFFGFEVRHAQR
jgi:hypothetical protein